MHDVFASYSSMLLFLGSLKVHWWLARLTDDLTYTTVLPFLNSLQILLTKMDGIKNTQQCKHDIHQRLQEKVRISSFI